MSLKILMIEEEPELEISHVPLVNSHDPVSDPELPEELIIQTELADVDSAVASLESICLRIGCEGMDTATARELDKVAPGFLRRNGGLHAFTATPSLEGLVEAGQAVKKTVGALLVRMRKFISDMFKRFREWITAKFTRPEATDIAQEVTSFLAERRNHDAVAFISELPDDLEEAAHGIAILMDGETKEFASALVDQLQSTINRVHAIEKTLEDNHTQFYLVTGAMTVKEMYKDDVLSETIKAASGVAQQALMSRNAAQFEKAMQEVVATTEQLKAMEADVIIQDKKGSEEHNTDISLIKMYDNVTEAVKEMQSVDVKQLVDKMTACVEAIIKKSDETKMDDVEEMIPSDVPEEKRGAYANQIVNLYREISKLGSKTLRLWKIRGDSIASLNKVGTALIGLVDAFEKAVVGAGGTLTLEQKTQLAKALAGKGLKIEF